MTEAEQEREEKYLRDEREAIQNEPPSQPVANKPPERRDSK